VADDPIRALRARLDAFALRADAGAVLDVGALADAEEALAQAGGQEAEAEALQMVALLHWHRHCLTTGGSADDLATAVELFTRIFHHDPDSVPESLLALIEAEGRLDTDAEDERVTWASLAGPFLKRYRADGRPEDMWRVIALLTAAWDAEPDTPQEQTFVFTLLVGALLELHQGTGDIAAIDTLVDLIRTTLADHATPAALQPMAWTALLHGLWAQSLRSQKWGMLSEAVEAGRRAIELVPKDQPVPAGYFNNLGAVLLDRYQHLGSLADLDESVHLLRTAVEATPPHDPSMPTRLGNLSRALLTAFMGRRDRKVLGEAVKTGRRALELVPEGQAERAGYLSNLGAILIDSYQHTGDLADLDESIHLLRTALDTLPATHPTRGEVANRLSVGQWLLHRATGRRRGRVERGRHHGTGRRRRDPRRPSRPTAVPEQPGRQPARQLRTIRRHRAPG
jgi:tetratricopeptide (TPR) repeat protein